MRLSSDILSGEFRETLRAEYNTTSGAIRRIIYDELSARELLRSYEDLTLTDRIRILDLYHGKYGIQRDLSRLEVAVRTGYTKNTVDLVIRDFLVQQCDLSCVWCSRQLQLDNPDGDDYATIEHLIPRSRLLKRLRDRTRRGELRTLADIDENGLANIVFACGECNCARSSQSLSEWYEEQCRRKLKPRKDLLIAQLSKMRHSGNARYELSRIRAQPAA